MGLGFLLTPNPQPQRMIRVICFDAVGTLISPYPSAITIYAQMASRFGSRLTEETIRTRFTKAFAREEEVDFSQSLKTNETREWQRWQRIVSTVLDDVDDSQRCFEELYNYFGQPQAWRCRENTGPLLTELNQQGYILALASNYDKRLRSVVQGLAELQSLSHLVISSEVGWRKPAPAFFAALLQTLSVSAEQILFVGDDPVNDYEGARNTGLPAFLVTNKTGEIRTELHQFLERLTHLGTAQE